MRRDLEGAALVMPDVARAYHNHLQLLVSLIVMLIVNLHVAQGTLKVTS